ncbi:centrosomal protein of 162 kDa isoform X4 [Poeciliopsis prolifica]|uniref:centrosomal protein of 162 kDa isoform X4 n=1 Tax=Poeciliopsis prolifica TaxID=188132 RepID=UPI0024145377|nr:centrosomal protein of 162 kDa isoform X4 [Poeciliopsis prolifica]
MSSRQTKEELDAEFRKFLKESVSDDSVDLSSPEEQPKTRSSQKSSQKPTVLWWQDENSSGAESSKQSLIKTQKHLTEHSKAVRSDSHQKPVIKPRSKTPDSHIKSDKIPTAKTFDVSQRTSSESQRCPTHETHQKVPERCPDEAKGIPSANNDGALPLRGIDESSKTRGGNMSAMGLDTLEEEEEKARFFAQIEAGGSSVIDYSKLNRELDSSRSTFGTELGKEDEPAAEPSASAKSVGESSGRNSEEQPCLSLSGFPHLSFLSAHSGSSQYSEDFEDEDGIKELQAKNSKLSPDLARAQLYAQSGGSEVESVQEAYRQIHSVEGCDSHHCLPLEDEGKTGMPVSSSSLSQQSLQPFSTNCSDLPTAEELIRPIRAEDHSKGFTLQPVSQELRTFPRVTPSAMDLEQPGQSHYRITEHPDHDLTSSIRKEVERLMQEQNKHFPQTLSLTSQGSSVFRSCMLSERKLLLAPSRGRFGDSKAAGKMSKASPTPKAPPTTNKSTKKQEQDSDGAAAETSVRVSSEPVASVQSTSNLHHAVPQDCSCTQAPPQIADSSVIEALRAQLAHKENELKMMKDDVEEANSLRQQNYLLQSKLRSTEEASQRWRLEAANPATEDKIQLIEKEMKEQEILIKGYQQENEKLYVEMKAEQSRSKANQDAMFNENQGLLSQLVDTREQLRRSSRPVCNVCTMDHTKHISDLLAQINTYQNEARLCEENRRLEQEKQSLQVELQLMKQEQELAKAQAFSTSGGDEMSELQGLQQEHREEVAALKNKLQWFEENQEVLDRDAGRLKAATAEILQLKEQVENLKREVGKRSSYVQRMRDLQRQVKELEHILRSSNPNSLPALIYAAATATGGEKATSSGLYHPSTVNVLQERRIQQLESELESHNEEAKRTLKAIEQQFHQIKLRYEQQICELEQQLKQHPPSAATRVAKAKSDAWMSKCQLLEEELRRVQDRHQQKDKFLQDQIESLQQQLKHKAQQSPGRHQRQAEAAFGGRIEWLNQELAGSRTIQEPSWTVERLQREPRTMLSMPCQRSESYSAESRAQESAAAADSSSQAGRFPAAQYEKTYQPSVFTGNHVSELQQENEALRQRVELLQLQSEQKKEELKANAVQAKEELGRLKEEFAEQLSCVKTEQLRVQEYLQATHAMEQSSSKVADLTNKLNSQEIAMKHLQQQLKELQECKEALSISRHREEAMQKQLTRLLQELKEAKEAQSSELKLLCSLERKIISMELRHEHRQKELQQVVAETYQMSTADLQSEVERWWRLARDKSRELDAFRSELESILDILRHLQKYGAVLPTLEPGDLARLL